LPKTNPNAAPDRQKRKETGGHLNGRRPDRHGAVLRKDEKGHQMKARRVVVALAAAVLLTQSAPAFAQSIRARKPVRQMTCGDFLLLDDAVKPEIVYWAATRDQRGGHVNAVIDVDATDSIVPALVEKCRAAPQASFWQTVKAETGRLGKKLYGPEPA
jgi:acid stress chaperone HdeA